MNSQSEKSNPYSDMARLIKESGFNKDVTLTTAVVVDLAPLTVKLSGNDLVTSNLKPMAHLISQYHPAQIVFNDSLGSRSATIMIDNGLELDEMVYVIYEVVNDRLSGFIIGKEE
ncbi:hypothetical protein [Sporosarcina sp. A2]|uniref:hypothetical protein n=1 Tax=Sporosarcina sp. A2 TaxID=3393449 RepID=UPI003D7B0A92